MHTVHAVAVRDGQIVAEAGDPQLLTFLRSSAKPLQALPLARARPDIDDRELAIACASHRALPEQLDAVRALLADAPATEAELETGPDPTPIEHNCSGKHAGFLAVCRARGLATRRLPIRSPSAAARSSWRRSPPLRACPSSKVPVAINGCGVPTFAFLLDRSLTLFSELPRLDGGSRVVAAMRAHPELLRGPVAADVNVRSHASWLDAKGGAEGLFCALFRRVSAMALKVEDGAFRAIRPALAAFLAARDRTGELGIVTVENSRGEPVGTIRTRLKSRVPKR